LAARKRFGRIRKFAGIAFAVLLALPVLGLFLLLARPAREQVLDIVLSRLRDDLPGRLIAERADWPRPGVLRLDELTWTVGRDTLLVVETARLDIDLMALMRRDLHVRELTIDCGRIDLPAMRRIREDAPEKIAEGSRGLPYLRSGALPPVPSLAVDAFQLTCERMVATETSTVARIASVGGLELRHEREPRLHLTGSGRDETGSWDLESFDVTWAPAESVYTGGGLFHMTDAPVMKLDIQGRGPRTFRLELAAADGSALNAGPGLTAEGRLGGGDAAPRTLDLEGTFMLPDLATFTGLAHLSPVEGVFGVSSVWDRGGPRAELDLSLVANPWLEGARLRASYGTGRVRVDSLTVALSGLRMLSAADIADGAIDARARIDATGTAWLRILRPDLQAPDSLTATFELHCTGPLDAPSLAAGLIADARFGETRLERLDADLDVDAGWRAGHLDWSLAALGLEAAGAAEMSRDEGGLTIRLTPVDVACGSRTALDDLDGRLRYTFDDSTLTAAGLRISGALGDLTLDGVRSPYGAEAHVAAAWPVPPSALALVLPDTTLDGLRAGWAQDAPWSIDLDASLGGPGHEPGELVADARLRLPGPRQLRGLLDAPLTVDDLGPLEGTLHIDGVLSSLQAVLDLSPTDWIETGLAAVRIAGDTVEVDSLHLAAIGLEAMGRGWLRDQRLDGEATLSMPDASALARLPVSAHVAGAETQAHLTVRFSGVVDRPELEGWLEGAYRDTALFIPSVVANARFADDVLTANVALPGGAESDVVHLVAFSASYAGETPGRGVGRLAARATAPEASLTLGATLGSDQIWTVTGDTLSLSLFGQELVLDKPFVFAIDSVGGVNLEGLSLSGSLGRMRAAGQRDGIATEATLDCAFRPPPNLYPIGWPVDLRPDIIAVDATLAGDDFAARIDLTGLRPGGRDGVALSSDLRNTQDALTIDAFLTQGGDTLAIATATSPGDVVANAQAGLEMPVSAELILIDVPLPLLPDADRQEREITVNGTARLWGTTTAPAARMDLRAVAHGWEDLTSHRLEMRADLSAPAEDAAGGLAADVVLSRSDKPLATGRLDLPGLATLAPAGFTTREGDALSARLETHGLKLDEFAPLLPSAVGLQGLLDLDLSAEGSAADPELTGRLSLTGGRATLPDGSWLTVAGTSNLAGRLTAPAVSGALEISGGVLRLPDPPKSLLPLDARPLLWETAGAEADSLPADTGTEGPAVTARFLPKITPTADVRLTIPSGLWLRGQGLEVELSGELDVRTDDGRHDVVGELAAMRGFYRFLGRTFQVERGAVDFDGDDVLDPALDIALTTRLDGALYRIAFGGTLQRPTLRLTSEPELPEGDIMSMLLFGRPLDELSGDQEGVVRDRATDLVSAFGTAQLEARLAQQLKVDMVTLRRGGAQDGGDALIIGKYIHQKVLLKYEQVLDEWSTFFVNLEYFLSRRLKLETMISRQSQSAAAINWSVEY